MGKYLTEEEIESISKQIRQKTICACKKLLEILESPDYPYLMTEEEILMRDREECRVYFIFNPDTNMVKIGIAKDIEQRLKELKTACGCDLKVCGTFKCDSRIVARKIETALHHTYEDKRIKGTEWFCNIENLVIPFNANQILKDVRQSQGLSLVPIEVNNHEERQTEL